MDPACLDTGALEGSIRGVSESTQYPPNAPPPDDGSGGGALRHSAKTPCTHRGIGLPGCPTCDPRGAMRPRATADLEALTEELSKTVEWAHRDLEKKTAAMIAQFKVEQRGYAELPESMPELVARAAAVWIREFSWRAEQNTYERELALEISLEDRTSHRFRFCQLADGRESGLPKLKAGKYRLFAVAIPIVDDLDR